MEKGEIEVESRKSIHFKTKSYFWFPLALKIVRFY